MRQDGEMVEHKHANKFIFLHFLVVNERIQEEEKGTNVYVCYVFRW